MNMQDYNRLLGRVHLRESCREEILRDGAAGGELRIPQRRFSLWDYAPALTGLAACLMLLICGGIVLSGLRENGLTHPASSASESQTDTTAQTTTSTQLQTSVHTMQAAEVTEALTQPSTSESTFTTTLTTAETTVTTETDTTVTEAETTAVTEPAVPQIAPHGYITVHMSKDEFAAFRDAVQKELFGSRKRSELTEAEQYTLYAELMHRSGDHPIDECLQSVAMPVMLWGSNARIPLDDCKALLDLVAVGEKLPADSRRQITETALIYENTEDVRRFAEYMDALEQYINDTYLSNYDSAERDAWWDTWCSDYYEITAAPETEEG